MDFLVMVEEESASADGDVLAHVSSVPSRSGGQRPPRDVVTVYGDPDSEGLALALAAAVESHRQAGAQGPAALRHLGVSRMRGAVGDSAWRNGDGELESYDVHIPLDTLKRTAEELLRECGSVIGRLLASLRMPDWPEGARRAIRVTLDRSLLMPVVSAGAAESVLDAVREADGSWWDGEPEGF
ncbi:MAG TPA: hypothetical protein VKZ41_09560 [Gemmatimonadales bacterium]|nr:hypothetical protein [Gemmatimonadales bacterium]